MKKIKLTKGLSTKIDDLDFNRVSKFSWYFSPRMDNKGGYAVSFIKGKTIYLHRFLLKLTGKERVDHKNGNGLDNRRSNLRIGNQSLNLANSKISKINTSGYKGVCLNRSRKKKKWQSYIKINYKHYYLGGFNTKEEAAYAYNQAALKYFGEFARLNII